MIYTLRTSGTSHLGTYISMYSKSQPKWRNRSLAYCRRMIRTQCSVLNQHAQNAVSSVSGDFVHDLILSGPNALHSRRYHPCFTHEIKKQGEIRRISRDHAIHKWQTRDSSLCSERSLLPKQAALPLLPPGEMPLRTPGLTAPLESTMWPAPSTISDESRWSPLTPGGC